MLLRLWVVSVELYFQVHFFFARTSELDRKIAKARLEQQPSFLKCLHNAQLALYNLRIVAILLTNGEMTNISLF